MSAQLNSLAFSENRLLAALPQEVKERLQPYLKLVSFVPGQVISESGWQIGYLYFPTTAIISLLYMMENGSSAEIGMVGREGVVGISLFMGGGAMPNQAVVLCAGNALRMEASLLKGEFARGGALHHALLRYTHALMIQISQTAVCNGLHGLEQQLCRLLLLSLDRLSADELVMTQELIAGLLGVRREGVAMAAHRLQENELISYVRGRIKILDRPGLEAIVCECYEVVRDGYDRVLGY
jgi:CRP-like cAMP-binding protein